MHKPTSESHNSILYILHRTLIAYDEFMNLILAGDVKERKLSSKEEIISSIGGDDKRVMICGFSVSIIVPEYKNRILIKKKIGVFQL